MIAFVLRIVDATLTAFCNADRVTFSGSMTPIFIRSTVLPVFRLKPSPSPTSLV